MRRATKPTTKTSHGSLDALYDGEWCGTGLLKRENGGGELRDAELQQAASRVGATRCKTGSNGSLAPPQSDALATKGESCHSWAGKGKGS